jgi:hypothetical protein
VEVPPHQQEPHQTLDAPLVRQISFGDLADPTVQRIVVAMWDAVESDDQGLSTAELLTRLASGRMEAWWVLANDGQPAGLITFECGVCPVLRERLLYINSATVTPRVTDAGWQRLFEYGALLAKERGCKYLQFDALPSNPRIPAIARALHAQEETHPRGVMRRYTVEVQ